MEGELIMKKIFLGLAAFLFLGNMGFAAEVGVAVGAGVGEAIGHAAPGVEEAGENAAKGLVNSMQCNARKCKNASARTRDKCFMEGAEKIQANPHCANSYYNAQCENGSGDATACAKIKAALGL